MTNGFHVLFILFFFYGCVLTKSEGQWEKSETRVLVQQNKCVQKSDGQFLIKVNLDWDEHVEFLLEGVWQGKTFVGQILGFFGEDFGRVEVSEGQVSWDGYEISKNNARIKQEVERALLWLGPVGIREILCGHYFVKDEGNEVHVYRQADKVKIKKEVNILKHKVMVESVFENEDLPELGIKKILLKSQFFYGWFEKKMNFSLQWEGKSFDGVEVKPEELILHSGAKKVHLSILDFE